MAALSLFLHATAALFIVLSSFPHSSSSSSSSSSSHDGAFVRVESSEDGTDSAPKINRWIRDGAGYVETDRRRDSPASSSSSSSFSSDYDFQHAVCSPIVNIFHDSSEEEEEEEEDTLFEEEDVWEFLDLTQYKSRLQAAKARKLGIVNNYAYNSSLTLAKAELDTQALADKVEHLESLLSLAKKEKKNAENIEKIKPVINDNVPEARIAFSVQLSHSMGPVKGNVSIVKYDHVVINEGRAFNVTSGKFVAPSEGTYFFEFHSTKGPRAELHAKLMINDRVAATTHSRGKGHQIQESGAVVLTPLSAGDEVYVTLGAGTNGVDYEMYSHPLHRYSTFSGFVIWSDIDSQDNLKIIS